MTAGALLAFTATAPAAFAQATADVRTISDEQGRFDLPVPAGWEASAQRGAVALVSPEEGIEVHVAAFDQLSPDELVTAMWSIVDPSFSAPLPERSAVPSREGVDETWLYDYRPSGGQVIQVIVETAEQGGFVTIVRGRLADAQRRAAQVAQITTGLEITGIEAVDLSGIDPALTAEDLDALRSYIGQAMTSMDIPGTSVAVVLDGEVVLLEGFGVRERGREAPITPNTLMMIGSTGKTMTSMLVARLADEGRLSWDTPVQEILPEFALADPEISRQVTIRHLLCACTGVPRRDLEFLFNSDALTAEQIIASLQTFEVFTGFGEAFQYSNQLIGAAGWAAAAANGAEWGNLDQGYFDAMQTEIFGPLGMTNTMFSLEQVQSSDNYSMPHELTAGGPRSPMPVTDERAVLAVAPAGAPWSTAEDMSRYLATLMKRGTSPDGVTVASPENLGEVWTPQVAVDAVTSYGLGWFLEDYHGLQLIHHGGNTLGFTSDLAFLPDAGLGIVVLTNARAANSFADSVRFRLFELAFDLPERAGNQAELAWANQQSELLSEAAAARPIEPAEAEALTGRYSNPDLGEVEVSYADGSLILDAGEFSMAFRSTEGIENASAPFVATTGLLVGMPLAVSSEGEERALVFGEGAIEYRFNAAP
jgi:CubicO group peptidase (beta-lactamase class C family)